MTAGQAAALGHQLSALVQTGQLASADELLAPLLAQRTPFSALRRIGESVGEGPLDPANAWLERIAADRTMGGWVVISRVLEKQLDRDLAGALARCRAYIAAAQVWYAADTLGEGVPGHALVATPQAALAELAPWRPDDSHWVRRAVGAGVHFWAKRSLGAAAQAEMAGELLKFLEPMFEERDIEAVKGVGWAIKTLGKHYPELVADWLVEQTSRRGRRPRALMVRKALTYLPEAQRARVAGCLAA